MRARNLKPGFFKNEELAEIPFEARILFIGLWCMADREGRLEDRPKRIKAEVFPYDTLEVENMLDVITCHGLILRYEHESNRYIQVVNFEKHQRPHPHEAKSIIPPCNDIKCNVRLNPDVLNPDVRNPSSLNPDNTLAQAPKRKPFQIPTVDEVMAYAKEQGFQIDADKFINHYGASGWMRGKTKITNWKLCANTWKNNGGSNGIKTSSNVRNLSGDPERAKAYAG